MIQLAERTRDGLMRDALSVAADAIPVAGNALPRGGFAAFARLRNPGLMGYEHIPRLVDVADRVAEGLLTRVLVIMPPRYFKSEVFSRLLPSYYLRRHPTRQVGLASYGAELAWELSEEARGNYAEDGGVLRMETRAKKRWRTQDGGVMWAAGSGGPLLGRGFHLGIVDDPVDPEKAHSPTYQRRFERWWSEKFLSRQEPGAAIIFVMQRLGLLDPVDYLLRREVGEEMPAAPEHWHVVVCDEVKSEERLGRWDGPQGLPATCTLEPDPRRKGEVLAPSRFGRAEVDRLQVAAGPYVAAAQRQQRPSAPEGKFWRRGWFIHVYDELPQDAHDGGKDWDTAYTKDEANSASAFVETYRGRDEQDGEGKPIPGTFPIYVHDAGWEWLEFPELVTWMKAKQGPHHVEEKASGKSAAQTLRGQGVPCTEVKVSGDKFTRAVAVQPIVGAGRVWIRRSLLRHLLEGERQGLLRVTAEALLAGGPDLDLNDAFTQALHRHTRRGPTPGVEAW